MQYDSSVIDSYGEFNKAQRKHVNSFHSGPETSQITEENEKSRMPRLYVKSQPKISFYNFSSTVQKNNRIPVNNNRMS